MIFSRPKLLLPCLLAGLLALASVWPARAGTISLRSEVRASLAQGRLNVWLTLKNRGDMAAEDLTISAQMGEAVTTWQGPRALSPGKPYSRILQLPFAPKLPGTYAVIVTVNFHDQHGYPFSSIAWGMFSKVSPSLAQLSLTGRPGEVYPGPEPAFVLVSKEAGPHQAQLDVFAPSEMTPPRQSFRLELIPGRPQEVPVRLTNRGALAGASYPLVGLVSYVQKGVHYTAAAKVLLRISQERDPLYAWRPWLWGLAALLLAALAAAWLAGYKTGRRR